MIYKVHKVSQQKLESKQKLKLDPYIEKRDLAKQDMEALELFLTDQDSLPKEFIVVFSNSHLSIQLQEGYKILKQKTKKTKVEMNMYLTGAAISAGYAPNTIRNWMPDELKNAIKAAAGRKGGYKRGFARKLKRELRGEGSISHDGGVAGSPESKSFANMQMQLQRRLNEIKGLGEGPMMVSLKIRVRDVDIKDCVAKLEEAMKKGKDIEIIGENHGYVDFMGSGFKLIPTATN